MVNRLYNILLGRHCQSRSVAARDHMNGGTAASQRWDGAKRKICAAVACAGLVATPSFAQSSISEVLGSIEANNPTLKISAMELEATRLENNASVLPEDPEIEFNYLWGQNSEVGNRKDFRVTQSFDIPTLTGMRSNQASARNDQAALRYKADRLEVLLEAKQLCIDLIYNNLLYKELSRHLEDAETLAKVTDRKKDFGESSSLEVNKAKLHLASVKGQLSKVDVERARILSELRQLNGGENISLEATEYDPEDLPADFQSWYSQAAEKNPVLQYVGQEIAIGMNQIRIDKASWLPNLTVGYMSEIGLSDKYRGVTLGIAIPLWRNTNKIRQTTSRINIARTAQTQAEQEFYNRLLRNYNEASGLKDIAEGYKYSLEETDNRVLLIEARTKGEISMIDYLVETDLYYDSLEEYLSAERDYRKALATLNAVNL